MLTISMPSKPSGPIKSETQCPNPKGSSRVQLPMTREHKESPMLKITCRTSSGCSHVVSPTASSPKQGNGNHCQYSRTIIRHGELTHCCLKKRQQSPCRPRLVYRTRRHGVENPNPLLHERHRSHRLRKPSLLHGQRHAQESATAKRNWRRCAVKNTNNINQ